MSQSRKVSAGKYYVNNGRNIAREVLEIKDDAVIFITYHLDTGASAGIPSKCMKQHFAHWVDHEATLTEIARLQNLKMKTLQ
jgi:hypothetical protein